MTFEQWKEQAIKTDERANRVRLMILERARKTARLAGLDPSAPFHSAHNATCGRQWAEVDYSLARKVLWLERKMWRPGDLASAINKRLWAQVKF